MGYWIYGLHNGDGVIRYVGMSENPQTRLRQHKWMARHRIRSAVHKWMAKYGPDNIKIVLLLECDTYEQQCAEESRLISELPNLLNHGLGGRGRPRGSGWSEEERRKHEEWTLKNGGNFLGKSHTEETRRKISERLSGRIGHKQGPETRAKLSKARMGNKNPNWGKSPTAETTARRMASLGDTNKCIGAQARVTWDDVREIRASNKSNQEIANRYGISPVSIWRIRTHRTWKENDDR